MFFSIQCQSHFGHNGEMVFGYNLEKPLLKYSETSERATFIETKTPAAKKTKKLRKKVTTKKQKTKKRIMVSKRKGSLQIGKSKKSKMSEVDPRFDFESKLQDWTSQSAHQPLIKAEYLVLDPNEQLNQDLPPQTVTFDLPKNGQLLLPGNGTRLYVEGIFEKQENVNSDWIPIPNTEASEVIVQPNWFEKMIEKIEIRSRGGLSSDLNRGFPCLLPFLNEMMYAHMDPEQKNYLCKEPAHPGNATTLTRSKWDFIGEDWNKYHPSIFNGEKFKFSYIPFSWPFFQNADFVLNHQQPPKAVDLSLFDDGKIAVEFKEFVIQHLFKKKNLESITKYRVRITDLKMVLEIGIPNPKYQFPKKSLYVGTTTLSQCINLEHNNETIKFNDIHIPNSVMLAFLPQNAQSGFFDYQYETEQAGFRKHPLRDIAVKFKDQQIYSSNANRKHANLQLNDATNLQNHLDYPIAGIPVDKNKMTLEYLNNDGTTYAFPHVYVRLSPGSHQRLMPSLGRPDQLKEPGNFEIEVRFTENQPINDKSLILVAFAFYDDFYNVIADVKGKTFYNPFLHKK